MVKAHFFSFAPNISGGPKRGLKCHSMACKHCYAFFGSKWSYSTQKNQNGFFQWSGHCALVGCAHLCNVYKLWPLEMAALRDSYIDDKCTLCISKVFVLSRCMYLPTLGYHICHRSNLANYLFPKLLKTVLSSPE